MNELSLEAFDAAAGAVGDGPVVMVNLLRFRARTEYPAGFEGARPDPRSAYYEGYVGGFRAAAAELGVSATLVYAGHWVSGLLAGPEDGWDDIVVVRYERFADLRAILASESYARGAVPHRLAGIADWRFIATRARGQAG
ncbi:hypothetical protein VQH23_17310 [Pararoseomonas sp. SCSIO 73927]|uniref:hypothetical protein n=1 Tax=Pararoseomonas sp. SCSIO 73927 TaxID=3114537 RepID=UPI0030CD0814